MKKLTDDSLSQEYIARGQRQVAHYSWESTVDNTIALYRQLLKSSPIAQFSL